MDTLARKLSHETVDRIVDHFALEEVTGTDGGPFMALTSPAFGNADVGGFRLWHGDERLSKLVYTGITVEAIGIDSHMLFAFTAAESLVPTFTLDSVYTKMPPGADPNFPDGGDMYSFHLDLVPRCDLGINHDYMRRVYEPLTEEQGRVLEADGVHAAQLTPTQRAIMSPWMLAQRTSAAAYEQVVFAAANAYTRHWLALVDDGLGKLEGTVEGARGAERDRLNRALIFNREIDAVWSKIDGMLGQEVSDAMIGVLRNPQVEKAPG
jgi:hypothetical protein